MINSVTLHVRLGRDPEVRDAGGKKVCSVSAAMSQGRDKPSLWLELTAWGDNRFAHEDLQALQKGQACVVQGRLTVREYEKDGQTVQRIGITVDRINASAERQQAQRNDAPSGRYTRSETSGRSYSSDGGAGRKPPAPNTEDYDDMDSVPF